MIETTTNEKALFFSQEEYDRRVNSTRQYMTERDIKLLLVFTPENILYLSGYQTIGYTSYSCLVVPLIGDMILFIREMELGCAYYYAGINNIITYGDHQDPVKVLFDTLYDHGLTSIRIGMEFDANFIGARRMGQLSNLLKTADIVDASGTVEKSRRIKSKEEIEYIRKACRTTEAGMQVGVDAIHRGATENQIAAAIFDAILGAGSTYMSCQPIVTSGPRSGVAHTTFDNRTIQDGDCVLLELGGCVNRYTGPLMRSVAVGNVPQKAQEMADACKAGLESAIKKIAPGVTSGEVHAICAAKIEEAGFETYFRKRTGYSVGVSYPPDWGEGHILSLRLNDPTILEPGMVFHIPPALREYNRWGVGMSETVMVTSNGCEVLTQFPRLLIHRQG